MTCISSGVHRVHGVQLARSLSNLRPPTLFLRAFAMYVAFLHSDYYAPSDCLQGLGVSLGISPFLLSTLLHIPFRLSRVHIEGLSRDDGDGVFLAAPSALCGSPTLTRGTQVYPCPHLPSQDSGILGLTLAGRLRFLDWLTDISSKVCQGGNSP